MIIYDHICKPYTIVYESDMSTCDSYDHKLFVYEHTCEPYSIICKYDVTYDSYIVIYEFFSAFDIIFFEYSNNNTFINAFSL